MGDGEKKAFVDKATVNMQKDVNDDAEKRKGEVHGHIEK
jgi:hypothetical protein